MATKIEITKVQLQILEIWDSEEALALKKKYPKLDLFVFATNQAWKMASFQEGIFKSIGPALGNYMRNSAGPRLETICLNMQGIFTADYSIEVFHRYDYSHKFTSAGMT